tara:strand:+ start:3144 stop:3719 length:576 start_codon:yes stop_codon:yes gene_type:complete
MRTAIEVPAAPTTTNTDGPTEAITEARELRLQIAELKGQLATHETTIKGAAVQEARHRFESGADEGTRIKFDGCHVDVKQPSRLSLGGITEEALRAHLGADFGTWFESRDGIKAKSTKTPVTRDWVAATIGEEATAKLEARIKFEHKLVAAPGVNNLRAQRALELDPELKALLSSILDESPVLALGGLPKC